MSAMLPACAAAAAIAVLAVIGLAVTLSYRAERERMDKLARRRTVRGWRGGS